MTESSRQSAGRAGLTPMSWRALIGDLQAGNFSTSAPVWKNVSIGAALLQPRSSE